MQMAKSMFFIVTLLRLVKLLLEKQQGTRMDIKAIVLIAVP
jgi:hypothetical protein